MGVQKKVEAKPAVAPNSDRRIVYLLAALLALATVGMYWQVVGFGFTTLDDTDYVTGNWHVRAGLTSEGIAWALQSRASANWHPLTWISHMLDVQVYGLHAGGHHITSLLLHLANVLLLFLLLRRMTGFIWRSAFVAAVFALHPIHVESVAWVAERKDVLSALFWLLTMWAYVNYVEHPATKRYLLVAAALALGLMAKPMLVTLPLTLLLLDYWPLERKEPFAKLLREKAPLLALAAASCVITFFVQRSGGAVRSVEDYPLTVRAANAPVAYMTYIGKMLWPSRLSALYPHPGNTLPAWQVASSAVALVVITLLAIGIGRAKRYVTVGWLWWVITLVPVIGLIQVGRQAMADRYTYVPSIGLLVVVAWAIPDLMRKLGQGARLRMLAIPSSVVLAALMLLTWFQIGAWRDGVTLFKHAVAATSGHYMVRCCLGDALYEQGRFPEALYQFRTALVGHKDVAELHNGLGYVLAKQGKTPEAMSEFKEAIRLKPGLPLAHNNLGSILLQQNRFDDAIAQFKEALGLKPDSASAQYNLATALDRQGKLEEATANYRAAVTMDPDSADAHYGLGTALQRKGDSAGAAAHLREALRIRPKMAEAHFYLAAALAGQGDVTGAREHLLEAARLKPRWGIVHYSLSTMYFGMRDYNKAWSELHAAQDCGLKPNVAFVATLSQKMPDPGK